MGTQDDNAMKLPDADLYLFGMGDARRAYLLFGCHKVSDGTSDDLFRFVVWAPHARAVSVVGDFNGWDENANPLEQAQPGIWATVIGGAQAGLEDGSPYKYRIVGPDGEAGGGDAVGSGAVAGFGSRGGEGATPRRRTPFA